MKLLVDEPGAEEASAIWSLALRLTSSRLLYPEARAALAAAWRAGRVSPGDPSLLRKKLEELWRSVDYVEVTPAVATRAGDLAETHRLRGYDAVHLSSSLEVGRENLLLVTGDSDLAAAARTLGVPVARVPGQSSAG